MNPHDLIGTARDVWWGDLTIGKPVELELVDYFKASDYKFSRGRYVIYYAIAASDYEPLGILKGDELIFHVSMACYVLALRKLKSEYRIPCLRKYADGKNLLIVIERLNAERIKVHSQEIREPTPEQLKEAARHYKLIKEEHSGRLK